MTPQALGAGAAGAAVIGGGGTLAAYAAGAFGNSPYGDYYLYATASTTNGGQDRKYIGSDLSKIQELLKAADGSSSWRASIKNTHWDEMVKTVNSPSGLTKDVIDNVKDTGNPRLNDFSSYINKWCERTARENVDKSKKENGQWDSEKFNETDNVKWKAFKEVCTIQKN
ncbi:hypothetical protein [Candidatus Mycoplasma haematohominis]|uniref:Uncharacterized protein n=1 Tax=Candidatus Mycoplasma haematohominis TaxID=1494318 RepID=A0A478FR84_9MOLU|nr:hypothetical protein [Candidatus Mycoplasma haemohominis]GCE63514.1 hypothetical protein MHSWG343_05110 [Candidatus Mycoplasma haemohominis]